ncbi:CxC2 domain-containing protein [Mycena chlorophos]|uniref:CxC2 domain-containing protein n=1 Tax=Mycena chlorophos TaxID=658473 RepID=A0A8H6SW37_MYCCL|nr:CxC2 domain-containing protein [Mycena chlorophos]
MSFRQRLKRHREEATAPPGPSAGPYEHVTPLAALLPRARVEAPVDAGPARVSADGRRTYTSPVALDPSSPLKRVRTGFVQATAGPQASVVDEDAYVMGAGEDDWLDEPGVTPAHAEKEKRGLPSFLQPADPALDDFRRNYRDKYLHTMLWRHGRGQVPSCCPICLDPQKIPEKRDVGTVLAESSFAGSAASPRTQETRFILLRSGAGFTSSAARCGRLGCAFNSAIAPTTRALTQKLAGKVSWCSTTTAFMSGWFPSTSTSPRTCATFACLDRFQTLSLQGKITPYNYYRSLEILTDATGLKPPDRYQVFMRMAREYRHLIALKRGGRGHDPSGVFGTKAGALVLRCPVCPRPDVNLPSDWESAPPEESCKYTMTIAKDACFRLKRRDVSNEIRDPGLMAGLGHFVEPEPYRKYLATISYCNNMRAIEQADTKYSRGYATTGVVMAICARHEFVLPNGVGDLQAGERFANVDWVFACIIRHLQCAAALHRLALPFLIAMVWVCTAYRFVVPKLHILGHKTTCQTEYSLSYLPGSGQLDGEGIEREWSNVGGLAGSTKVRGPGARADALEDHWAFWNWTKLVGSAAQLRRKMDKAVVEQARQEEALIHFSAERAESVPEWKARVVEYEKDRTKPNPYEPKVQGLSEAKAREQIEQQEDEDEKEGRRVPISDISPCGFMFEILSIEAEQRRVLGQAELKKAKTSTMNINLRALRRKLNKRIARLRTLQATYTPGALRHLETLRLPQDLVAEKVPLVPPSAIPQASRVNGGCVEGLLELEQTVRDAQCRSALAWLRNLLHIKYRLLIFKILHTRHQVANTRARALIARNESKILSASRKYQQAWRSLVLISGEDAVKVTWNRLRKEDIRCMQDSEELAKQAEREQRAKARRAEQAKQLAAAGLGPLVGKDVESDSESDSDSGASAGGGDDDDVFGPLPSIHNERLDQPIQRGEGTRTLSWIWTKTERSETDAGMAEAIEWAKAWARARRWNEELIIVKDEARRLPISLQHESDKWLARAGAVPLGSGVSIEDSEGQIAYAVACADVFLNLRRRAEQTITEPKLRRGVSAVRYQPVYTVVRGGQRVLQCWEGEAAEDGEDEEGDGRIEIDVDADVGNASEEEVIEGDVDDD